MRVSIIGNLQSDLGLGAARHPHAAPHPVLQPLSPQASMPPPTDVSRDHALPPLRLALHGLDDEETSILEAILRVLGERTARRWVLSDGTDGDLLLTRRGAAAMDTPRAAMTALLLRDDETPAAPDELAVHAPLRVMAVLDLLNAAHDRLRQSPTPLRITAERPGVPVDDDKSLASALARLVARRPEQALRARIVGHGTLYLCLSSRLFHCDFPRERLPAALKDHRFVVTMIPSTSAEIVVRLDDAWPIDEALWQIGLITSTDGCDTTGKSFRLTRWPDFARLPHRPEFLKLCALMGRTHRTVDALMDLGALRRDEVEHLLHACVLCGYVDVSSQAPAAPATAVPAAPVARAGLFDRLRRRFGL